MTLHYQFPADLSLDEVRAVVAGARSFVEVDRGDYVIFNYVLSGKDTHPEVVDRTTAIRRELRGIVFDKATGTVVSRPFHKFFNWLERDDVVPDFSRPHVIFSKYDGSMICPFYPSVGSGVRWRTKMGVTDVSMQAEVFVATRHNYSELAGLLLDRGRSPIFEWCSRKNRIVLDYPEDRLVLLAVRDDRTGEYWSYDQVRTYGESYDIPLVEVHHPGSSTELFLFELKIRVGIEGVVVRFDDGHMIKVKTDEYVRIHRARSLIDNERDVLGLVLLDKVDDLLPLLPEADRDRLRTYADEAIADVWSFVTGVNSALWDAMKRGTTRKEFALAAPSSAQRSFCFKHWDDALYSSFSGNGPCTFDSVREWIERKLGSRQAFEQTREVVEARWIGR